MTDIDEALARQQEYLAKLDAQHRASVPLELKHGDPERPGYHALHPGSAAPAVATAIAESFDAAHNVDLIVDQLRADYPQTTFLLKLADPDLVPEIDAAIRQNFDRHPELRELVSDIEVGPIPEMGNALAVYNTKTQAMTINVSYAMDAVRFRKVLRHSKRTGALAGKGDINSVITHEMGHALTAGKAARSDAYFDAILDVFRDFGLGRERDGRFMVNTIGVSVNLSDYAATDPYEAVAEAFAEVETKKRPKPLAKALYDRVIFNPDLERQLQEADDRLAADVTDALNDELAKRGVKNLMGFAEEVYERKHLRGQHDQRAHGFRAGGRIDAAVDVETFLQRVPARLPGEEKFKWQSRILTGLDAEEKGMVLSRIRERYRPCPPVARAATAWRTSRGLPEPNINWANVRADTGKARKVADAYLNRRGPHADSPEAKAAYDDFKRQNEQMWQLATRPVEEGGLGIVVEFVDELEPYASAEEQAIDVDQNRHIKITRGDRFIPEGHPHMSADEYSRFRAVHDIFGHVAIGGGFDRHGEYAAWLAHNSMYSEPGRLAMSTEYHGTNSVLWTTGTPAPVTGDLLPYELTQQTWNDAGLLVRKAAVDPIDDLISLLGLDAEFANRVDNAGFLHLAPGYSPPGVEAKHLSGAHDQLEHGNRRDGRPHVISGGHVVRYLPDGVKVTIHPYEGTPQAASLREEFVREVTEAGGVGNLASAGIRRLVAKVVAFVLDPSLAVGSFEKAMPNDAEALVALLMELAITVIRSDDGDDPEELFDRVGAAVVAAAIAATEDGPETKGLELKHGDPEEDGPAYPHKRRTVSLGSQALQVIEAEEARGNSRAVSPEEFALIASKGKTMVGERLENSSPPKGLDDNWSSLKDQAWEATKTTWGGVTIDAHTGEILDSKADVYAITVKAPGQESVSVPLNASPEQFKAAMDEARKRFAEQLAMEGGHLGTFNDPEAGRIDIDPILVVESDDEVEAIGAYTHAIGGAYHFATGNAYFPPHVLDPERPRLARPGMHFASPSERAKVRPPIPPAWTEVQIANDGNAPLQVIGKDGAGRWQYRYSAEHTAAQAAKKFKRVQDFAAASKALDKALKRDYKDPDAGAVILMRRVGLRPGSDADTKSIKKAYGATTLEARHVSIDGDRVRFRFVGKDGVDIDLSSRDPLVVQTVRHHKGTKRGATRLFDTSRAKADRYLKTHAPGFKLKDLRTAFATGLAAAAVARMDPPRNNKEYKKQVREVAVLVSKALGNTPAIALSSYINPVAFARWEANLMKLAA